MGDRKSDALKQEQTGQVFPDKDVDTGVWTSDDYDAANTPENEKPKAQVRKPGAD